MKDKFTKWFFSENSMYQVLVFVLNPIVASSFPIVAFIIFMLTNNFFSYDFFTNGVFGLNIFFIVSILMLILMSFFLVGSIIPLFYIFLNHSNKDYDKLTPYLALFVIVLFNIAGNFILYSGDNIDSTYKTILLISSILINIHIAITLYASSKAKLHSLVFVGGFLYVMMILYHSQTADLVEFGISKFSMGGNKNIIIKSDTNQSSLLIKGKLLLLTPNRIFIKINQKIKIVERNGKIIDIVNDENNSKLQITHDRK
jgi:hypothetical protein